MVFDLPVSGEKVKPQQVTALHLFCGLAYVGTGAIIYVYNFEITYWGLALLLLGIALLAVTIVRNKWLVRTKANLLFRIVELVVAVAIAALSFKEQWKFPMGIFSMLTAAIVFSLYWERGAGQQLFVHVDDKGIRLPVTSRRRFIGWDEVEQVVLRYGVLSIDCVDNKLHQLDLASNGTDKDAFETFCAAQVAAHSDEQKKNNW